VDIHSPPLRGSRRRWEHRKHGEGVCIQTAQHPIAVFPLARDFGILSRMLTVILGKLLHEGTRLRVGRAGGRRDAAVAAYGFEHVDSRRAHIAYGHTLSSA